MTKTKKCLDIFFLGLLAALTTVILEVMLNSVFIIANSVTLFKKLSLVLTLLPFILSALLEETVKILVIVGKFLKTEKSFQVYCLALLVGFAFAITETSVIFFNSEYRVASKLLEIISIGSLHILTAGLSGFIFSSYKEKNIFHAAVLAALLATLFHLSYNFFALYLIAESHLVQLSIILFLCGFNFYAWLKLRYSSS